MSQKITIKKDAVASGKSQSGFSLVEIIVVMFIVSVLFTMSFMEVNALLISHNQQYEDIAYHIANKEMETLRETNFSSLASSGTISNPMLTQIPSGSGNFTVADYPSYTGLKQIIVTVTWNDGAAKSVVIKTLAGTGGINP